MRSNSITAAITAAAIKSLEAAENDALVYEVEVYAFRCAELGGAPIADLKQDLQHEAWRRRGKRKGRRAR